jgi:hypothetical protein
MIVASVYTKCFALLRLKDDVKTALKLDSIEQATIHVQLLARVIAKEVKL